MSGWTPWRRTPAPIRALCDQTPEPLPVAETGRYAREGEKPGTASSAARDLIARLRAENARLRRALAERSPDQAANQATIQRLTALLEQAQFEAEDAIRERDDECIVNEQLRDRIRELEAAASGPADTVVMPRVRSGPPPGMRRGR